MIGFLKDLIGFLKDLIGPMGPWVPAGTWVPGPGCGPGPVLVPAAWPRDPGPGSRPGPMGPWVHGPYQILKETYQILKETYQILKETYQILKETYPILKETYQILSTPKGLGQPSGGDHSRLFQKSANPPTTCKTQNLWFVLYGGLSLAP